MNICAVQWWSAFLQKSAALWEVRAELRRAAGQTTQAAALFLEAADQFAALHRPIEENRCRAAAGDR